MTDTMEVLFSYAQEQMIQALLYQEHEYASVRLCVEHQEQTFLTLLDDTTQKHYDDLRSEQNLLSFFYEQAAFCAGFRLAMELSR